MDEFGLQQQVPRGARRYQSSIHHTYQTLDLCLTTGNLSEQVTFCGVRNDLEQNSNHFPVSTKLDITIAEAKLKRPFQWKNADNIKIIKTFTQMTSELNLEPGYLTTRAAVDEATEKLAEAIDKAIAEGVPRAKITRHSTPGFTKEWEACTETQRGISSELAVHTLVKRIYIAWKTGQIISGLLLDVIGAFNNVSHLRQLHNLRKRRICDVVLK